MKLCWRTLGTAITTNFRNMGRENTDTGPSTRIRIRRSRRSTTSTASTQLTPWHRKVAQATPATPMSKAVTNRISTAILAVEDTARNRKGVRESPMAEKMPVAML